MVQHRLWRCRVAEGKATGDVVSQADLNGQLADDCIRRPIEHLAQAALVGELHDEADPVGMVKDNAEQLHDVRMRNLVERAEFVYELHLQLCTVVPLHDKVHPLGGERIAFIGDAADPAK